MWILIIIVIIVGLVIAAYLALRAAPGYILGLYDRALRNRRDRVDPRYELPVYAHRMAYAHLAHREITIDCTRLIGRRRFVSDLPTDFGLRASLGRL